MKFFLNYPKKEYIIYSKIVEVKKNYYRIKSSKNCDLITIKYYQTKTDLLYC